MGNEAHVQELKVDLGANSYPIWVGAGLLSQPQFRDQLRAKLTSSQVVVVSNETVAPLYMDALLLSLIHI